MKSQQIFEKKNNIFVPRSQYPSMKLIEDSIEEFRNKIFDFGLKLNAKRKRRYRMYTILLKKYFAQQLDEAWTDKEKRNVVRRYRRYLTQFQENSSRENIFQRLGLPRTHWDEYDDSIKTALAIELEEEGFLENVITEKHKISEKSIELNFFIERGPRYKIKNYEIDPELGTNLGESLLKKDDFYSSDLLSNERKRIYRHLKNLGYVFFDINTLHFYIKKNIQDKDLDIELKLIPEEEMLFQPFAMDQIEVKIEDGNDEEKKNTFDGIIFTNAKHFNKKRLRDKIPFQLGENYTLDNEELLYKRLLDTSIFSSINMAHSLEDGKLHSTIKLFPAKKVSRNLRIGFNKSLESRNTILKDHNVILPYVSEELTVKNLFHALEVSSLEVGFFGEMGYAKHFFFHPKIQAKSSVKFPYLLVPFYAIDDNKINFSTEFILEGKYIFSNKFFFFDETENKEEILLKNFKLGLKYHFDKGKHDLGITLIPIKFAVYKNREDSIRRNFLLTKVKGDYLFSLDEEPTKDNSFIRNLLELYCYKRNTPHLFRDRFIKNTLEVKKIFHLNSNWDLVTRAVLGGIWIFYWTDAKHRSIPSKVFYKAGGANTVRGFDYGSLGPGQKRNCSEKNNRSELLFVFSNELRRKFLSMLEGAVFVDVGNTWRINSPDQDANFSAAFLKDMSVGCGFGLRLNFKFVILNFDLGFPLYSPGQGFFPDTFQFYFGIR